MIKYLCLLLLLNGVTAFAVVTPEDLESHFQYILDHYASKFSNQIQNGGVDDRDFEYLVGETGLYSYEFFGKSLTSKKIIQYLIYDKQISNLPEDQAALQPELQKIAKVNKWQRWIVPGENRSASTTSYFESLYKGRLVYLNHPELLTDLEYWRRSALTLPSDKAMTNEELMDGHLVRRFWEKLDGFRDSNGRVYADAYSQWILVLDKDGRQVSAKLTVYARHWGLVYTRERSGGGEKGPEFLQELHIKEKVPATDRHFNQIQCHWVLDRNI